MIGAEHERRNQNGRGPVARVRLQGVPKIPPENNLFAGRDQRQAEGKIEGVEPARWVRICTNDSRRKCCVDETCRPLAQAIQEQNSCDPGSDLKKRNPALLSS